MNGNGGLSARPYSDINGLRDPEDEEDLEDPLLENHNQSRTQHHNWRNWWTVFLKGGNDLESARVNHQFTPEERVRLANVESIDYLAPNSQMYRRWLANQPHRRLWDRWIMMGSIGVATGIVAHLLYLFIDILAAFKYGTCRWLLAHTNVGVAWLFTSLITCSMVAASSAIIVGWAPEAQGSGVPEVMAYLNGCSLPKVFNVKTLIAKFASCMLAVGSGLPVGPEGPLIHIGAALGSALSQGHSTTLKFTTDFFKRFRNPKDKRDFVTAGVSVGVAAAFSAPIGGLLFAFEEVASFWQHSLGWQVFFACMCSVLALNLSRSAIKALIGRGKFGWFNNDVTFEVATSFSSHILAVPPALVIGLLAGCLAIAFTALHMKLARVRDAFMSHMKWKRVIEPVVLALIYVTVSMVAGLVFFPCVATECIVREGQMFCGSGLDGNNSAISTPSSSLPLYTCSIVEHGPPGNTSWLPHGGSLTPDDDFNATETVYYNELATLLFIPGEESLQHLFARRTHKRFGYFSLSVMGVLVFLGAAFLSGSAISSGLFVPMLMIGAILGRIVGLATVDVAQALGKSLNMDTGQWTWVDPGAFALVGAGAFMGGVTRLTVALAVIMMELSSDVHLLLPVLVAIMMAKWVADAVTHSLYHGLLEVKCVPFLVSEPVSKFSLDLLPVSFVMKSPVVTLQQNMKVRDISDALRHVSHNGFPVVRDTEVGQVCVGLITRSHLMALLQAVAVAGTAAHLEVEWQDLNRRTMDPVMAERSVAEAQMVVLSREMDGSELIMALRHGGAGGSGILMHDVGDEVLDLSPYMNTSAFMVPDTFSIHRTYILFRTMGLRHLVVVDEHNHVRGIVSRKDLLGYRLDDALTRSLASIGGSGTALADWDRLRGGLRRRSPA